MMAIPVQGHVIVFGERAWMSEQSRISRDMAM
jgi:hypothetical protein